MRETENTAYARKREFLLCTDICGSALDTLRSRQEQAYCPALVEVFALEEHAQEARRAWMSVALESRLRGMTPQVWYNRLHWSICWDGPREKGTARGLFARVPANANKRKAG